EDDSDSSSGEDSEIDQDDISDSGNNEPDDLDNGSSDNNNHAGDNLGQDSQESDNLDDSGDALDESSPDNEGDNDDNNEAADSLDKESILGDSNQDINSAAENLSLVDVFLQDRSIVMKLIAMASSGENDMNNATNVLGVDDQSKTYWPWALLLTAMVALTFLLHRHKTKLRA
ncbi:MAG: hypothetical protein WDZ42_00755, partial [Candidatus Saccharimonadales bacterium]